MADHIMVPDKMFGYSSVRTIEPSSSSDKIFIGSSDGRLRLWDINSGVLLKTVAIPINSPDNVTMLSDNSKMLIADKISDNACQFSVWDLTTGDKIDSLTKNAGYFHTGSSMDGLRVISNVGNTIKVWEFTSGDSLFSIPGPTTIASAVISPDGSKLFTGYKTGESLICDVNTGDTIKTFGIELDPYSPVTFFADGSQILCAAFDTVKILKTTSGDVVQTFPFDPNTYHLKAFLSPDESKIITIAKDTVVSLWDIQSGTLIRSFPGQSGYIYELRFSIDGSKYFTYTLDGLVRVWDVNSGNLVRVFSDYSGKPDHVSLTHDNSKVLISHEDRDKTLMFDASSNTLLRIFPGLMTGSAGGAISRDGSEFVTVTKDSTIRIWNCASGDSVGNLKINSGIKAATFSDSSRLLVHTIIQPDTHQISLIDVSSGNLIRTIYRKKGTISGFAVSPDDSFLLTTKDSTATLWEMMSGDSTRSFYLNGKTSSASFSPDGTKLIFTSQNRYAEIRDAITTHAIQTFSGGYWMYNAVFSPDGKNVLTNGSGNTQLWDVNTARLLHEFETTTLQQTYCVAFSFDGFKFLSGNDGGNVMLWTIPVSTKQIHTQSTAKRGKFSFNLMNRKIVISSGAMKLASNGTLSIFTLSGKNVTKLTCTDFSTDMIFTLPRNMVKGSYMYRFESEGINGRGMFIITE